MKARSANKHEVLKQKFSWKLMWKQRYLFCMSVPFVIWLVIFKYLPLWGWSMAFQDVRPKSFAVSIWEREFVGLNNFLKAFTDRLFLKTIINTLGTSSLGLLFGTISAIFFALMLNEMRFVRFKKITQTISYLPHFVSWVIIASIAKMFLNDGGVVDTMLHTKLHLMSTNSPLFWVVVCLINVWKEVGWDAIIYLSALAGIDQGLYEAAKVDGANRFQRMWHISLPGIKPTVIVIMIMSIGGILNIGMERQMLLSNGIVQDNAMVLSWFAYVRGIGNNNYGLGTAIGMFQSLVGIILLVIANKTIGSSPNYTIDPVWLARVNEVVDYAYNQGLYVILDGVHGDGYHTINGSWLLVTASDQVAVKDKYQKIWSQYANLFKDYDEHLIFKSMNEVFDGNYYDPDPVLYQNLNDYNQIFVDTIRQTGGNNASRWLLVPGWNTNIHQVQAVARFKSLYQNTIIQNIINPMIFPLILAWIIMVRTYILQHM